MPDDTQVINPGPGNEYRMPPPEATEQWRQGVNVKENQNALAPASPLATPGMAKDVAAERQALQGPMSQLQTLERQKPKVPNLALEGPPPDAKDFRKHSMEFASAMALIGAIGSKFTRQPGGAALNAFAGAMDGWQKGNLQAYQQESKRWEQEVNRTIDNNNIVLQKYKLALADNTKNIDEQMSTIQLIATEYHDQLLYDAAAAKNFTMVAKLVDKGTDVQKRLTDSVAPLQHQYDVGQASLKVTGQQVAMGRFGNIDDPNNIDPRTGQVMTEEARANLKFAQQGYQTGQFEPRTGRGGGYSGRGQSARNQWIADFVARNGYQPTQEQINQGLAEAAGAVSAARATATAEPKALGATLTQLTKQQASINSFERTAEANGDKLIELAKKVDKTGMPIAEKYLRQGRQAMGDVDVAEFMTQLDVYRAEVAKIITNPNLTGVLSDAARNEVQAFLAGGASAPQIEGVVNLLKQDFGRRSESIKYEIDAVRSQLKGGGGTTTPPTTIPPAVTPSAGGGGGIATKPQKVIQNGHEYTLQPDGSYK